MKMNLNIKKTAFNDIYFPFLLDYNKRYEVYYGGSGSGKSVFVAQKLLIKALQNQRKILVVRKVARTLHDSVFQLLLDYCDKWRLGNYITVNKSTYTIDFWNGSKILFKGIDDGGEKIKSITGITDIWIEEATELSLDEFTQLDLRLRDSAAYLQIFLSFNPVSKVNWVYQKWFAEEAVIDDNTRIVKSTYKDNRFLPQTYVDALEAMIKTNPTYYRIYALGDFCSLSKLVITNWEIGDVPRANDDILLLGLDFGYINDPSAFICAWLNEKNKTIYVFDEMYEKGLLNNQIAAQIKYKGYTKETIIADSAEQKSIEEIRREGIKGIYPAVKGQGSVLQGIQKLQQYKIVVNPACANTITELENYSYKKDKKTNEYVNEPEDRYNHLIDALRYSLQCMDRTQRVKTLNKSILGL